jgi:hypothetical protein
VRWLLLLILLAGVASADETGISVEAQDLDVVLGPFGTGPRSVVLQGWAGAIGATDTGLAGEIGAEFAVVTPRCRWVAIGGSARFATDGSRSVASWGDLCLFAAPVLGSWQLHHHLDLDAHPSLATGPSLRRETFSRESIGIDAGLIDMPVEGWRLQLWPIRAQTDIYWKDGELPDQLQMRVDVPIARVSSLAEPERGFDILPIQAAAGGDAMILTLGLATFRGAAVGPFHVDVEPRWAFGGTDTLDLSAPVGRLAVGWRALTVAYDRTLTPTPIGDVVLDDRLTAAWSRGPVRLRAFAARTEQFSDRGGRVTDFTGGAGADLAREVGKHLELAATVEGARSFYAILDGGLPRPAWGARAFIQLTARFVAGN